MTRDPLCEEALRTNRELRLRCEELERRLRVEGPRRPGLRARLTAVETQLRECQASPWTYLPWKGYVS